MQTRILDYAERELARQLVAHLWERDGAELTARIDRKLVVDLATAMTADRLSREKWGR